MLELPSGLDEPNMLELPSGFDDPNNSEPLGFDDPNSAELSGFDEPNMLELSGFDDPNKFDCVTPSPSLFSSFVVVVSSSSLAVSLVQLITYKNIVSKVIDIFMISHFFVYLYFLKKLTTNNLIIKILIRLFL
ncbi:hypothetical protein NBO_1058g0001 [Nosema bombycis CQ1]|uniref:Uncharacterized protein n=1 Tax=Nosema bombycis (strain CQ1 / CVCC 102059) TaxID=578461 RepID=R0MFM7_NOSB1|nr:hypothetical protein NBO_1058g0001 [Nosema bombycis CQ1]|eukprot:EOB11563.1 hypothetical protein NBO_1058g0001 [Nosema bombycis CQ1]